VRERFAREVQAAQRVPSHCTARILTADPIGSPRHIVSEYVEGMTDSDLRRRRHGVAAALGQRSALPVGRPFAFTTPLVRLVQE
jgi:hypothetical protein